MGPPHPGPLAGLAALALCAALLRVALDPDAGLGVLWDLEGAVHERDAEIADLERERVELIDRVRALRDDPEQIERVAREHLGMVRPGEVVIRWSD
ncbi:MAG: septum formation initiator family protein [Myxococcota bacterium]